MHHPQSRLAPVRAPVRAPVHPPVRAPVRRLARPLPAEAFLRARQVPGYQKTGHQAIRWTTGFERHGPHRLSREKEGLEIFEGRKPDVIHYVSPPAVRSTEDFPLVEARAARRAAIAGNQVLAGGWSPADGRGDGPVCGQGLVQVMRLVVGWVIVK